MRPARSTLIRLVPAALLLLAAPCLHAQEYSASPDYQKMIAELHTAAPSPAYIATGERPQPDPALQVTAQEDPETLRLTTPSAIFTFTKSTQTLTWKNLTSSSTWNLTPACPTAAAPTATAITRSANTWTLPGPCNTTLTLNLLRDGLAQLTVTSTPAPAAPELQFHVAGGGPFFGLGERFVTASLADVSLDVRPQDRYGEPGHNWVYVAIPLIYSPGGTGLYADTVFDTHFRINPSDSSFDLKVAHPIVSLYLFATPSPKAVLTAYTSITGRPQMPPLWTFGPWITALGGRGPVLNAARRIRDENMPASALWVFDDLDEQDNLGWPFWYGSYYGDARRFTDTLHGQGFKVLNYVHPYLREQMFPYTTPSPNWATAVDEKLLATGPDGLPAGPRFEAVRTGNLDFTNPKAVNLWQTMITHAVKDQGFDGWMEDFGEWVRDADHFAAGSGAEISEIYPLLYHKITLQVAQALNPAVAPFVRSGSPGSQQWSVVLWGADQWTDWSREYGFPSAVTAGITAGMSGFSTWGPDILSAGSNKELWERWVEFGALTPVMRDHVWDKPAGSWNVWSDAETTAHFKAYAQLHSALLPYFVTYADQAHRTGIPIMRHTVLEFPDDPRSASAEYQYFLGREILVAPVVTPGGGERALFLPPGQWVNFWSGGFYNGGQNVTVDSPLGQIPMMIRAGSVLPMKPEAEAGRWNWSDPTLLDTSLIWHMFLVPTGDADHTFTLPNGTSAHLQQHGDAVTLTGVSKSTRDYEIIVRSMEAPTNIRLNGAPFPAYTAASAHQPVQQWWWNPSSFELHLLFRAANFRVDLNATPLQY
jgi:alpha-glucosidase (family GH31 glycosyl hydrolase)